MPQWQSYRHSTYIVITTYSYNQFLLDYLLLWGHTIKRRWIFICAKKKSLFMDTISKLLFILVTYSMSPFCKVFSLVGLLLSLLQSVFLGRSFTFTFTFAKCFPWLIFYFYFYFCQVFSLVGLLLLMLEILAETVTSIKISTTSAPTLILITLKRVTAFANSY